MKPCRNAARSKPCQTANDDWFEDIGPPRGAHQIEMPRNIKSLQRYEYEEPYEITQEVTVTADGEAVVNFDLTLRPTT